MGNEIRHQFDLPLLLKLGDLDIRGVAAQNRSLSFVAYLTRLALFLKNEPSVAAGLFRIVNLAGDEAAYRELSDTKDMLVYIGYHKLIPDIEGILSARKKGDSVLASHYAKRVLPELGGLYKRTMTAYEAFDMAGAASVPTDVAAEESLKTVLQRLDYGEENRKLRILAVDDATFMLKTISSILNSDYEVFLLSKPASVENFLRHMTPELFLLDYTMPEINGFELVPVIRSFEEHKDTPIIFLTAMGTAQHVTTAASLGACDYVVKPVRADVLREKIAKHIVRKKAF